MTIQTQERTEGMNIHGLKCDKRGCGYRDDAVPRSAYERSVGRPCPKCGSSLLTQADMDAVLRIEKAFRRINFWFGWLSWFSRSKDATLVSIDLNGTGKAIVVAGPISRFASEPETPGAPS